MSAEDCRTALQGTTAAAEAWRRARENGGFPYLVGWIAQHFSTAGAAHTCTAAYRRAYFDAIAGAKWSDELL